MKRQPKLNPQSALLLNENRSINSCRTGGVADYVQPRGICSSCDALAGTERQRIRINAVINTELDMRTKLRLLWYWLETRYAKLLRLFGVVRSTDCIPEGMYCYEYDEERNAKNPTDGYWIKTCKYYRSTPKTKGVACTYVGYIGFDPCLYDQCKICGVKDSFENKD